MKNLNLTDAVVIGATGGNEHEENAVAMLLDEVRKRTMVRWRRDCAWPSEPSAVIVIGQAENLNGVEGFPLQIAAPTDAPAEGYSASVSENGGQDVVVIRGNDSRGVLFGIGYLLRKLGYARGGVSLSGEFGIETAPSYKLRGHQIGYRDKTNSYCGWDAGQWEQYIRDLAVFGANSVEVIPPRSDDNRDSIHFPAPPLEMVAEQSRLADAYGLDLWVWYPAMDDDYEDPDTVEFALKEWGEVFAALPRIDAVFVPGGDPGHSAPKVLFPFLEKQTENLRKYHPNAEVWLSPQGFYGPWEKDYLELIAGDVPWLKGLVHGPWVHYTLQEFRKLIPERYPIRYYPDITHSLRCQYGVPEWDLAHALTASREPINPRPEDEAAIFHANQPFSIGSLTYCEGCNDDINKAVWSGLGWDPQAEVRETVRDYGNYFIGSDFAEDFTEGVYGLEKNWRGPLAANEGVEAALAIFQKIESVAPPRLRKNWRLQQTLYRAYYDAYTRARLVHESALEREAMAALRDAPEKGALEAIAIAQSVLARAETHRVADGLRTRVLILAEALFQSIHMQLSVERYGAQSVTRGANLDGLDVPLNDRVWLEAQFADFRACQDEGERLRRIADIVAWEDPGSGGVYVNLGAHGDEQFLPDRVAFERDPSGLYSPYCGFTSPALLRKNVQGQAKAMRTSWMTQREALLDRPLRVKFAGLSPEQEYRLRVVYGGETKDVLIRLVAGDGVEIHGFMEKPFPFRPLEFAIPREASASGTLELTWNRDGAGMGSGRGCQVSEVWLLPVGATEE